MKDKVYVLVWAEWDNHFNIAVATSEEEAGRLFREYTELKDGDDTYLDIEEFPLNSLEGYE